MDVDVICVGLACWDITYSVQTHPGSDEKTRARKTMGSPGGPALNAAVQVARLGGRSAFLGRLGNDAWGEAIAERLESEGVRTGLIHWDHQPTPIAAIIVKPDGSRAVVSPAPAEPIDPAFLSAQDLRPKLFLFDGHQMPASLHLQAHAAETGVPTLLDAGSQKPGMDALSASATFLAASTRFAESVAASSGADATKRLHAAAPDRLLTCITAGEQGLHWTSPETTVQHMAAFKAQVVDTNGCGDAFHGALAWACTQNLEIREGLKIASMAGSLAAQRAGAFTSLPSRRDFLGMIPA